MFTLPLPHRPVQIFVWMPVALLGCCLPYLPYRAPCSSCCLPYLLAQFVVSPISPITRPVQVVVSLIALFRLSFPSPCSDLFSNNVPFRSFSAAFSFFFHSFSLSLPPPPFFPNLFFPNSNDQNSCLSLFQSQSLFLSSFLFTFTCDLMNSVSP